MYLALECAKVGLDKSKSKIENLIKYIEDELNLIDSVYLLDETDEDVRRYFLSKSDIYKDLLERIKSNNYD